MKPILSQSQDLPGRLAATVALACGAGLLAACPSVGRAQAGNDKMAGKDYALVHKSSYTPSNSPRNPFGWVPTAVVPTAEVVVATVKPEDFVVTSISMDYPPLAVINKRTYSVGDKVPVQAAGATPGAPAPAGGEFVTVRQINDGVIVLDHRGKLMRVAPSTPSMSSGKK